MANNYYYDRNGRYIGSSSDSAPTNISDVPWWFALFICGIPIALLSLPCIINCFNTIYRFFSVEQ